MKNFWALLCLVLAVVTVAVAKQTTWTKLSGADLRAVVPEKAPVVNEHIETEFRTASGITDGRGHHVFGVVIITAGYAAEGKYTHYFVTQTRLKMDGLTLDAGEYVFGYQRAAEGNLRVIFYRAADGERVGEVTATAPQKKGGVYSFLITPPKDGTGTIHVGRFSFAYSPA